MTSLNLLPRTADKRVNRPVSTVKINLLKGLVQEAARAVRGMSRAMRFVVSTAALVAVRMIHILQFVFGPDRGAARDLKPVFILPGYTPEKTASRRRFDWNRNRFVI